MDEFHNELTRLVANKYRHILFTGQRETWNDVCFRVVQHVVAPFLPEMAMPVYKFLTQMKIMAGGRYYYAAGRRVKAINNCMLFRAHDSKEGWAEVGKKNMLSLMLGAGVGNNYSDLRPSGEKVKGLGGYSSGPLSLIHIINEQGKHIRQGASRRSAIWSGLNWKHGDIFEFIESKNWSEAILEAKNKDVNAPAPLDNTNISVGLDDQFFEDYTNENQFACEVYNRTCELLFRTGDPAFTIDIGKNAGEVLRNACTEVTSADDYDVCNLGSCNLERIKSIDEFKQVVRAGIALLMCGSVYSEYPFPEMKRVVENNRRIGLGLMGIHAWLIQRGKPYGMDTQLGGWLSVYAEESDKAAREFSSKLGIAEPIKKRAIAPTGSISIVAETTSGIEPVFATSYVRSLESIKEGIEIPIIDIFSKKMFDAGITTPNEIETALTLDFETRLCFQSFVQQYVDMGISSTVNIPKWGSKENNKDNLDVKKDILMKYLPNLRGITIFPNGGKGSQPITPISYDEALKLKASLDSPTDYQCVAGRCGE